MPKGPRGGSLAGSRRIGGPPDMPPGGPKLKSSDPCRNSAAHGLPSAARGASQIWSNSQESDHQATCDRLSSPPDTPHDRRSREDRPSGAASTARTTRRTRRAPPGQPPSRSIISGTKRERRSGDFIVTMLGWDSLSATPVPSPRRPTSRPSRHQNDPDEPKMASTNLDLISQWHSAAGRGRCAG